MPLGPWWGGAFEYGRLRRVPQWGVRPISRTGYKSAGKPNQDFPGDYSNCPRKTSVLYSIRTTPSLWQRSKRSFNSAIIASKRG